MKIISLNVGRPQLKTWHGKPLLTSIFKTPVTDRRKVSLTNIEGDEQSDLNVHGGINKAIYSYDVSHYHHWKRKLEREDWPYGLFGENLTTSGLEDDQVRIGNIYQIGTAIIQAVQPRFPCTKINLRFNLDNMVEQFIQQRRSGIYFKVLQHGLVQVNDEIKLVEHSSFNVTIQDHADCYYSKGADKQILKTLLSIPFLPERQRAALEAFLYR